MSERIEGNSIKHDIERELKEQVSHFSHAPTVGLLYVGNNKVIEHYIGIKQQTAERMGIRLEIYRLPEHEHTETVAREARRIADLHDGVVVQLPLPSHIDSEQVLDAVPLPKDIDMLSTSAREYLARGNNEVLPPVVGAIREIQERFGFSFQGKKVVVVGRGKLVGLPVTLWLKSLHVTPMIVDKDTKDFTEVLQTADIIISGAGSPGLITSDMIKEGVILFDAGTSEMSGKIRGDVDPGAYERASYYTPVPGGIGPLTVVCLFKNLITLIKRR